MFCQKAIESSSLEAAAIQMPRVSLDKEAVAMAPFSELCCIFDRSSGV